MSKYTDVMSYLKSLGLTSLDTFEGRVSIQKIVYILRQFGAELPFGYTWYAHGPYSPDLTKTLFNPAPGEEGSTKEPTKHQLAIMNDVRTFLGSDFYSVDSLELIASLIFLINHAQEQGLTSKAIVNEFLWKKKPQFSNTEIEAAWKRIKASGRWNERIAALQGA